MMPAAAAAAAATALRLAALSTLCRVKIQTRGLCTRVLRAITACPPTIMATRFSQPIDKASSPVPSSWALKYTDAAAQYAQELWADELQLPGAPKPQWDKTILDQGIRVEIKHLVSQFVQALHNQCM